MEEFLDSELRMPLLVGISVSADVLCTGCWSRLEPARGVGFLARPSVSAQNVPIVSPFYTNDELLELVRFLKFSGGRSAVPALGWWMAAALGDYLARLPTWDAFAPLLVPIPLHPKREKQRGYNQAALLAHEVAERLGLEVDSGILARTRNTKAQSTLESYARAENVEGAFSLMRQDLVNSRNIIIVDDLITTGETALACVASLLESSPSSVTVLSVGRARG